PVRISATCSFMVVEHPITLTCDQGVTLRVAQVGVHHLGDELLDGRRGCPAELLPCLGRVAQQGVDLGRPEVARIDAYNDVALPGTGAGTVERGHAPRFSGSAAFPGQRNAKPL